MCHKHLQCTQGALFSQKLTSEAKDAIILKCRNECKLGIQCDSHNIGHADPTATLALQHLNQYI